MNQSFAKLHKEWTSILAKHGFNDIEARDGTLKNSGRKTLGINSIQETMDFFLLLDHLMAVYPEMPDFELKCMTLYSEGKDRRFIANQLNVSIRKVDSSINRYKYLIRAIAKLIHE